MASNAQSEVLKTLTSDQKAPVLDYNGPSFILAGPGAGKTHTVVSRTRYMILDGVDPSKIILFTFTNKAAKEIQNRVIDKIGEAGRQITVGTYHSICVRFLRKYAEYINRTKNFTIFDTEDSLSVIKKLPVGEYDHRDALSYISDKKSRMVGATMAMQQAATKRDQVLSDVYRRYQKELDDQDAMDFDDLIYYTILLFERSPEVIREINSRYHYIVADEFHDSSPRDIRLIELLAGEMQNVCMILDDEQSIYRFRGADIGAVLSVNRIFPSMKTFVLQQNFRSTNMIVRASRSLISHNENQLQKTIFTANEDGTIPIFFEESSQEAEASRVQMLVKMLTSRYGLKYSDIAVLYRMSYLSRAIEQSLLQASIPYRIVGGTPFYARKEVKDILCYARLVYNPMDYEAFKRVINVPKRGLGETSVDKIFHYARTQYSQPISFVRAAAEIELKGAAKNGLAKFNRIMAELMNHAETDDAAEFITRIVQETDYVQMVLDDESESTKAEDRLGNLQELANIAATFDTLEDFLQSMSLDSQINEDVEDDNKLNLQTQHSSKGLEYKAVIMIGCNESISPHFKAMTPEDMEEERRLFYVGMTRAEKYLFMTRARYMMMRGQTQRMIESRFINEIDPDYLERYTGKR